MRLDSYTNTGDGRVHLHKHGCRDVRRVRAAEKVDDGDYDWPSKEAFGANWWADINAETDGPPYDWQDPEFKWYPCTNTLPDKES